MAQKKTIVIEAKDKTGAAFKKVKKNLKQTDQAVDKTKRSFDGLKAGIKGAIGALTIGAFVQATRSTLDMADALGKTSARLGLTTEGLQTLRFAATQSGMTTEMLEMSLQRFTRRLAEADEGTGVLKDTFKELGIDIRDPNDRLKSAESLLGEVADKMSVIPEQGKRVKMAFSMFDSEGVKMVNMLQGGKKGFDELRQSLIDTGAIMEDEFIETAAEANDALDQLGTQFRVAFANAISGLSPLIISIARGLGDVVRVAKEHPFVTAFAGAVSAVGLAFSLFGGPVTLALAALGAIITGASIANNHFKNQAELANLAGVSLSKLERHYKRLKKELDEVTLSMKKVEDEWNTTEGVGLEKMKERQKGLADQLFMVSEAIKKIKDKGEAEEEAARKSAKALRDAQRAEREGINDVKNALKEKEAILKRISDHEVSMAKKAADLASKARMDAYNTAQANISAIQMQRQAHADWMDQKEGFRDAEGEALQEEHERQKAMVDAAYMGEVENKEAHTANMLLVDERYNQAVIDLAQARKASILAMANALGQSLWKQGLIGFDAMRALAVADATVNAQVAATRALRDLPQPYSYVAAGIIYAAAMARVYEISKMTPKREHGGGVSRGQSYMVGERGPELFTPNQSGGITPNNQLGNANVTFNVIANDTRGFDQLLQARRGMIVGMINNAMRNNAQAGIL